MVQRLSLAVLLLVFAAVGCAPKEPVSPAGTAGQAHETAAPPPPADCARVEVALSKAENNSNPTPAILDQLALDLDAPFTDSRVGSFATQHAANTRAVAAALRQLDASTVKIQDLNTQIKAVDLSDASERFKKVCKQPSPDCDAVRTILLTLSSDSNQVRESTRDVSKQLGAVEVKNTELQAVVRTYRDGFATMARLLDEVAAVEGSLLSDKQLTDLFDPMRKTEAQLKKTCPPTVVPSPGQ